MPPPPSFICISGVLPEKARLDAAGAIKVNLRETCILLSIGVDTVAEGGADPSLAGSSGITPLMEAAVRRRAPQSGRAAVRSPHCRSADTASRTRQSGCVATLPVQSAERQSDCRSAALPLRTAAHQLHTRFAKTIGASVSESSSSYQICEHIRCICF